MPDTGKGYIEELWIGIKADYESLRLGLKQSQDEIRSFVGHIGNSSEQLKKFGTVTTLVSGAVIGLGTIVVNTFAKFEQSMANANSVLGATKYEFDMMSKYARLMGQTSVVSAKDAADAMYYLASAGYDTYQTMAALKPILELSASTQYDLAETSKVVVGVLNSFQLSARDAGRVANVFAANIAATQAEMDKLGVSFKYIGPISNQLGISLEQISAALGELYNAGFEASQAGTYLRQGITRLQAPTNQAKQAIKSLGLSLDDVNPQIHSLVEIIRNFEKAGAGMIDKGDELAHIVDVRSAGAFALLIQDGANSLEALEKRITGTNKAQEMMDIQMNTFSGAMKILKNNLIETAIQFGTALQPVLRGTIGLIKNLVSGFNLLPPGLKTVLALTLSLSAGFGMIVGPVALLLAKLPTLIAEVTALGTSFYVSLGWVVGIAAAITAVIYAIGAYSASQSDLMSETNQAKRLQTEQITQFEILARRYLELGAKAKRTAGEQALFTDTVRQLQTLYPQYFKNMDVEKAKYDDVKSAIERARVELKKYLDYKLEEAVLADDVKKAASYTKDLIDTQIEADKLSAKMKADARKVSEDDSKINVAIMSG